MLFSDVTVLRNAALLVMPVEATAARAVLTLATAEATALIDAAVGADAAGIAPEATAAAEAEVRMEAMVVASVSASVLPVAWSRRRALPTAGCTRTTSTASALTMPR